MPMKSDRPIYDAVVWYKASAKPDLSKRIIEHVGRQPDEDSIVGVFGDLHWNFESPIAAIQCAESLFEFAAMDNIVYLVVSGYKDDAFERKVYKDTRKESQSKA